MFDFSWGDGGLTFYWPNQNQNPTVYPGGPYPAGTQYNPYAVPPTTQLSTGTLLILGILVYLILKK